MERRGGGRGRSHPPPPAATRRTSLVASRSANLSMVSFGLLFVNRTPFGVLSCSRLSVASQFYPPLFLHRVYRGDNTIIFTATNTVRRADQSQEENERESPTNEGGEGVSQSWGCHVHRLIFCEWERSPSFTHTSLPETQLPFTH